MRVLSSTKLFIFGTEVTQRTCLLLLLKKLTAAPALLPKKLTAAPALLPKKLTAAPALLPKKLTAAPALLPKKLTAAPALLPTPLHDDTWGKVISLLRVVAHVRILYAHVRIVDGMRSPGHVI
ncbi:hypothetical protein ACHWQZ_G019505 [Mnemiopsis leidyi]